MDEGESTRAVSAILQWALATLPLAVGTWLQLSGDSVSAPMRLTGALMSALAGAYLGVLLSRTETRDATLTSERSLVKAKSLPIQQQLHLTIRQLSDAQMRFLEGQADEDTLLYAISQGLESTRQVLSNLQSLTGERISLANDDEIAESIYQDLARRARRGDPVVDLAGVRSAVKSALESQLAIEAPTSRTKQTAKCPYCDTEVSFLIGDGAGESATPNCEACANRFHAFRQSDGTIGTKQWGATKTARSELQISCVACSGQFPVRVADGQAVSRVCLDCGEILRIEANGTVTSVGKAAELTQALAAGERVIACPKCHQERMVVTGGARGPRAGCLSCRILIVATATEPDPPEAGTAGAPVE